MLTRFSRNDWRYVLLCEACLGTAVHAFVVCLLMLVVGIAVYCAVTGSGDLTAWLVCVNVFVACVSLLLMRAAFSAGVNWAAGEVVMHLQKVFPQLYDDENGENSLSIDSDSDLP